MNETINELTPIQYEIVREIYKAFENLGAGMELLAAIGSWGDTLPEEDVLDGLIRGNEQLASIQAQLLPPQP